MAATQGISRPGTDLGALAALIGKSGGDLGSGARVTGMEVLEPALRGPALSGEQARKAADRGLGGSDGMLAVAMSKAGEARGQAFLAQYGPAGFMLASDLKPERQAAQMAQVASAGTDELQQVLRVGALRQRQMSGREVEMRADAIAANYPQAMAKRYADAPDRPREDVYKDFVKEVGTWDFSKQRKLSAPRDAAGAVVLDAQGRPAAPTIPEEDRRSISALTRGYNAIDAELRRRGVEPEVSIKGAENGVSKGAKETVAAGPAAKGRIVRDGVEM